MRRTRLQRFAQLYFVDAMADAFLTDELKCSLCHGSPMAEDKVVSDDSVIKCRGCGQNFGTLRDFKAKAFELAKERLYRPIQWFEGGKS